MKFAYELSSRQSSRLIEQARRQAASIQLQPRTEDANAVLVGTMLRVTRESIRIQLDAAPPATLPDLLGCYCDGRLSLNGNRYLFETSVIELGETPAPGWLEVSTPERLSVGERRRFWRASVSEASQVLVTPMTDEAGIAASVQGPIRALLCNLSPDGMACTVNGPAIDALLIGEPVRISFELPTQDQVYALPATVCNKMPAGTEGKYIVGIQFTPTEADATSRATIEALRRVLYANPANAPQEGNHP